MKSTKHLVAYAVALTLITAPSVLANAEEISPSSTLVSSVDSVNTVNDQVATQGIVYPSITDNSSEKLDYDSTSVGLLNFNLISPNTFYDKDNLKYYSNPTSGFDLMVDYRMSTSKDIPFTFRVTHPNIGRFDYDTSIFCAFLLSTDGSINYNISTGDFKIDTDSFEIIKYADNVYRLKLHVDAVNWVDTSKLGLEVGVDGSVVDILEMDYSAPNTDGNYKFDLNGNVLNLSVDSVTDVGSGVSSVTAILKDSVTGDILKQLPLNKGQGDSYSLVSDLSDILSSHPSMRVDVVSSDKVNNVSTLLSDLVLSKDNSKPGLNSPSMDLHSITVGKNVYSDKGLYCIGSDGEFTLNLDSNGVKFDPTGYKLVITTSDTSPSEDDADYYYYEINYKRGSGAGLEDFVGGSAYFTLLNDLEDWLSEDGMTATIPLKYNKGSIKNGTKLYVWYKSSDGNQEFKKYLDLVIDESAPTLDSSVNVDVVDNILKGSIKLSDDLSGVNKVVAKIYYYDLGYTSDFNFLADKDGLCEIDLDLNGFSKDMVFKLTLVGVDNVGNEFVISEGDFNLTASDIPTQPPVEGDNDEVVDDEVPPVVDEEKPSDEVKPPVVDEEKPSDEVKDEEKPVEDNRTLEGIISDIISNPNLSDDEKLSMIIDAVSKDEDFANSEEGKLILSILKNPQEGGDSLLDLVFDTLFGDNPKDERPNTFDPNVVGDDVSDLTGDRLPNTGGMDSSFMLALGSITSLSGVSLLRRKRR